MRVLVVDDEVTLCSVVAEYLRDEGFEVVESYSSARALILAKEEGASLSAVVTDVCMPEIDGMQMWQRIKPLVPPECKIIFMSGLANRYRMDGVTFPGEIIQKPFSFSLLLEKLSP